MPADSSALPLTAGTSARPAGHSRTNQVSVRKTYKNAQVAGRGGTQSECSKSHRPNVSGRFLGTPAALATRSARLSATIAAVSDSAVSRLKYLCGKRHLV